MLLERRIEQLRGRLLKERIVSVIIILFLLLVLYISHFSAHIFAIQVNDKTIGWVKDRNIANQALKEIKIAQAHKFRDRAKFQQNIKLKKQKFTGQHLDDIAEAKDNLSKILTVMVKAEAIYINHRLILGINNRQSAEKVLNKIKDKFVIKGGQKALLPTIKEKIEIKPQWIEAAKMVSSIDEGVDALTSGGKRALIYIVKAGDSAWSIAPKFNITVSQLREMNPKLNIEKLSVGMKLNITKIGTAITVITKKMVSITEKIPYKTEIIKDNSLYQGQRKVKKEGKRGKKQIEKMVIFENGVKIKEQDISQKIITPAVNKKVIQGTKERPKPIVRSLKGEKLARLIFYQYRQGNSRGMFRGVYGMRQLGVDVATAHSLNHAFGIHYGKGFSWHKIEVYLRKGGYSFGGGWHCAGGPHNPYVAAKWIRKNIIN